MIIIRSLVLKIFLRQIALSQIVNLSEAFYIEREGKSLAAFTRKDYHMKNMNHSH